VGLELGNHTYSHKSLNVIPLEEYKADTLRGETITKELLSKKKKPLRFFRHPFLQTGRSLEIKNNFEEFLREHDYIIAAVTFDNSDWIFARAYDNAFARGDKKTMEQIGEAYVPYLESKVDYWERQSVKLFAREVRQIFLLHANSINADYFDDVVLMLKKRGYEFITLEEALKDEAYKSPDKFTGGAGISWLHRWAITKGREYILADEPYTPAFVMKEAGVTSE
jgi:peptidoglycan/xylan/chitin deacetylase (PgdA/CDA1 family)